MSTSRDRAPENADVPDDFVLPELRPIWWETGVRARAEAGILGVFAELPGLIVKAIAIAWRTDRIRTATVAAVTVAAGVMATFGLLATQRVLVELFAGGPTPDRVRAALPALLLLGAATAIRGAMGIATGYALNGLTPRVNQEVERRLFEHTTAVRLEAFDDDAFSEGMERATRGSEAAIELVEDTMNLFAGVVSLLAVTVAVMVIHPLLLLALLVATVPTAYAALRAGHERFKSYLSGSTRRRRMWVLQQLMAERVSAPELRSYGLRHFLLQQHDRVMGAQTAVDLALARRVTTTTALGSATGGLALGGVYTLLGVLLVDGQIPLAAAATCVVAVQAAQRALTQTTFQIDRVFADGQFFNEYVGFLERAVTYLPGRAGAASTPEELREISVRGVSLTYPDRDQPAVDDLTITIRAGETIALVGENGSGKSSLAAMIAGLREPTSGVVAWNGRALREWDTDALRARIGVVLQEHHKWPFSAATNIAMGDLAAPADRGRIERAAALAAAHEMILDLPHGYDTLLDRTFKDGQDLSGGQWQRVTAARGFLRDGDLLIMDEPSSALDPRAEDQLFQAIRTRQGTRTTILITHRLANVTHADRILVMHDGALTEAGSHDELMRANGRYAELFTLQSKGYRSGPAA
ncbi:ABC transporter ATP-binding protein [Couchioplanes caeruleus]|uniref:ABC transporter n=2 Tax=Couchioplanes caeruleus TaxID=56438 RepID=A0A1K0GB25_9ACTN|nr:ABC transporter ATP-binding protein [Couchioplanes caeruleus]OJF14450.1 ABC transporter [Couchioplanes caeruleus subsp. caeruleus]ROP33995.1 ATP-binding cassette subfamily B protein [Couchioplanes caeruleus]